MEVFWAKGFDGASMTDLTTAMGIGSPSLYAAFGSKEKLFREAVDLYGAIGDAKIWNVLPEAATAREAVERFLHATAKAFTEPGQPAGCMIVLGALNANETNASVCESLRQSRAEKIAALRDRLEQGVREGELPVSFDCAAAADFYATVQHGMSIQARDGASREALAAIADCAMAAWDGLVSRARA
jgi:AcrR family transcriptional regulator